MDPKGRCKNTCSSRPIAKAKFSRANIVKYRQKGQPILVKAKDKTDVPKSSSSFSELAKETKMTKPFKLVLTLSGIEDLGRKWFRSRKNGFGKIWLTLMFFFGQKSCALFATTLNHGITWSFHKNFSRLMATKVENFCNQDPNLWLSQSPKYPSNVQGKTLDSALEKGCFKFAARRIGFNTDLSSCH